MTTSLQRAPAPPRAGAHIDVAAERRRLLTAYFRRWSATRPVRTPLAPHLVEHLDEDQALAVELAASPGPGALVVTGEAGTGKTHVLRALATALGAQGKRMAVVAVTHRALHVVRGRLGTANVRYLTLAKLMRDGRALRGVAVVVVEEASMVSDAQCAAVVLALDGARLVLVGDPNQLPPLSAGTPLRRALASGAPSVRLRKQYRQGVGTGVLEVARAIKDGRRLERVPAGVHLHTGLADPKERLVRLVVGARRQGQMPLVLTWRRDDWVRANLALQARVNPHGQRVGVTVMEGTGATEHEVELRVGDRVASKENLPGVHFYNGMTGVLEGVDGEIMTIRTEDGRDIRLPAQAVGQLELGYCLTAHRAQGGEWPRVIVYLPSEVRRDAPQWFYTAVTRARERLDIVSALDREELWSNALNVTN